MTDAARNQTWQNTDAYEAYMGRWSRPMAEAALRWLQPASGHSWLDVGCGTGALVQAILEMAAPEAVLGVDPSADFITTAAARIDDPRVRFEVGTAADLPAASDRWDIVIAGLVLHFVPDAQQAVAEMARVARAGGTAAAYVWDFGGEPQLFTHTFWQAAIEVDPTAADHDPRTRFPICAPGPLTQVFAAAGLREIAVESVVMPVTFRDFDDYWQPHLLAGSSPAQRYANSLDEANLAALRTRLLATLPIATDGSISLLGRAWAVRGTKAA